MKKDLRWIVLATLCALALLLGAPLYHRYKVAGEEVAGVEIYYYPAAPLGAPSNKAVLKYQASGEEALRTSQQWQIDPNYRIMGHPSFWMSDYHSVVTIRRNGEKSHDLLDIVTNRVWRHNNSQLSPDNPRGGEGRLTPQSLRYFRELLAPKKS